MEKKKSYQATSSKQSLANVRFQLVNTKNFLTFGSMRMFLFQAQTEDQGVTKSESVSFSISKN